MEGKEVEINGKPIGNCTGDAFSLLQANKLSGVQIPTHQWVLTDPLVVPALYLMPDILKGMQENDETCLKVHNALVRYNQLFMSIIKGRRAIDNPKERWGKYRIPFIRPERGQMPIWDIARAPCWLSRLSGRTTTVR